MPFMDAYIPKEALSPRRERELVAKLTDLLIEHEGSIRQTRGSDRSVGFSSTDPRSTSPAGRRSHRATASSVRFPRASTTLNAGPR